MQKLCVSGLPGWFGALYFTFARLTEQKFGSLARENICQIPPLLKLYAVQQDIIRNTTQYFSTMPILILVAAFRS